MATEFDFENAAKYRDYIDNIRVNEINHEFKNNTTAYFNDAVKSSVNVGKDEIDEVHIIYNYIKSEESTCRYIAIPYKKPQE